MSCNVTLRTTNIYAFVLYGAIFATNFTLAGKFRAVEDEWKITL